MKGSYCEKTIDTCCQQQRVAIARALVGECPLILADEPTGALDQKTGREVLSFIEKLNSEGKTIVIITHDESIAAKAKRIIYVEDGMIKPHTVVKEFSY